MSLYNLLAQALQPCDNPHACVPPPSTSRAVCGVPIWKREPPLAQVKRVEEMVSPKSHALCADLTAEGLTGYQILIQTIHCFHVALLDVKSSNLRILDDTLLLHTLGQWHVAMLQTPAD